MTGEKRGAIVWLLAVLLGAALVWCKGADLYRVETDLMQLLPSVDQQPAVNQGRKRLAETAERRVLFMVTGDKRSDVTDAGVQVQSTIRQSGFLQLLDQSVAQQQAADFYQQLLPYRYQLLTGAIVDQLEREPEKYLQDSKQLLYSPAAFARTRSLERDPLYLFGSYFEQLFPASLNANKGVLLGESAGVYHGLVVAEVDKGAFDLDQQERLLALIQTLRAELAGDLNLHVTGLPVYAASGSNRAQREIRLVGMGSLVGVVLLLIATFAAIRPLLLAILAIATGIGAAWTLSGFLFGQLHILTLVFGASLVGVAVDYCLHYFCSHLPGAVGYEGSSTRRRQVVRSMTLALVTTVVAYLTMASAPFPGLRQMAVFSATGLVFSWLTVVLLFPFFLRRFCWPRRQHLLSAASGLAERWGQCVVARRWFAMPLVLAVILGSVWLHSEDDVRQLQMPNADLKAQEESIKSALPSNFDSRFFVVEGTSETELLDRERKFAKGLQNLQREGDISGYQGLSQLLPNKQKQRENYRLLQQGLYDRGAVAGYLADLGFDDKLIAAEISAFKQSGERILSLGELMAVAPDHWKTLFLGCEGSNCRSIVRLQGVRDVTALQQLQLPAGVYFVDTVNDVSDVMATYRQKASLLLLLGIVAAAVLLSFWLGKRRALLAIGVPAVAIAITLGALGWLGETLNLFRIFALLLLLGIGADFGIFAVRQRHLAAHTALAIGLSAITTLLAFGLLSVSDTGAVRSFGQTLLIGIAVALLLSPVAARLQEQRNGE
ncbi:MMPL family transporter [Porticoccus sp. W117]|uniref:MMPL family transporter n=1 Tax=Porticoccus sp. W117 TaxID=3054777 RepID=UPI00259635CA|nr:MMPL family transporter [Porticoccus sp. W117]MDM3869849.1 MMPL family transporter [Porticoccus sp. W117]